MSSDLPNQAYRMHNQASKASGVPSSVTFQVTDLCNYNCSHCYQEHIADNELSFDEVSDVLRQLAEAGVLFLTLMGGEFFMRKDADRILATAHELGFAIKLLTTGHHISEKRAKFLASIRPLQIDISIYGSKPAVHEHITQQAGSWERSFRAIRRLVENRVSVTLKTPVMQSNMAEVEAIRSMAEDLDTGFVFDPIITAVENGDQSTVAFRMNSADLASFYDSMSEELDGAFSSQGGEAPLHVSPCKAGNTICSINPRGEVWPCNSLPWPVGNLRTESFRSIWQDSAKLDEVRNLHWATISECNRCELRGYCSRCHGMALIEHGTINGPSLEACRHAVAIRDSLRERGKIPQTETQLPPTWDRVSSDGQHTALDSTGRRSAALRILP